MEWNDQYKHPLWQKKRLEALEYSDFQCENCGEKERQLHVHHVRYKKKAKIWDYRVEELSVLCDACHAEIHAAKEAINDLILMSGAGTEILIAELASGYFTFQGYTENAADCFVSVLGYGAGYLSNLESSEVLALTKIPPALLSKFIKENS